MSELKVTANLATNHHIELNKTGISRERFTELGTQYQDDPVALWEIDHYDSRSKVMKKLSEYRKAHLDKDPEKIASVEAWFQQNDPKLKPSK